VWLAALVVVSVASAASETRRVRDVRLGAHREFDRVVIELDGRTRVERRADPAGGGLELWLEAQPSLAKQRLETSRRLGRIDLEAGDGGAYLRVQPRAGRSRVFLLERPFRVVVDVAPPAPTPLAIPEGAEAIPTVQAAAPPAPPPPPEPVVGAPPPPAPAPPPIVEVLPPTPPAPAPAEKQPEPIPPPAPEPAEPEPALPATKPAPPAPPEETRAPPPKSTRPVPPPTAKAPKPPARPAVSAWQRWLGQGLTTLAALAGVAALAVFWIALRRRRAALPRVHESEEPVLREPDTIRPTEIVGAADRLEIVEKRLDEEARARAVLEERVSVLQEELKVLRDRTNRLMKPGL
jgi:hypothetical protein